MSTYDKIAWLPLCGGVTGLGLILSYLVMRRRGLGSGLRGAAWSLLPLAAYLTGAIQMFWKMGAAIGDFAKGFAFSPEVWSGIILAGLAVVLFTVSGPLRSRRVKRGNDTEATGPGTRAAGEVPAAELRRPAGLRGSGWPSWRVQRRSPDSGPDPRVADPGGADPAGPDPPGATRPVS